MWAIYAVDIMDCDEDGLHFLTARGKSLSRKKLWSEDENTNGFTFDEFVNVKNPAENAFNEFAEEKNAADKPLLFQHCLRRTSETKSELDNRLSSSDPAKLVSYHDNVCIVI